MSGQLNSSDPSGPTVSMILTTTGESHMTHAVMRHSWHPCWYCLFSSQPTQPFGWWHCGCMQTPNPPSACTAAMISAIAFFLFIAEHHSIGQQCVSILRWFELCWLREVGSSIWTLVILWAVLALFYTLNPLQLILASVTQVDARPSTMPERGTSTTAHCSCHKDSRTFLMEGKPTE